MALMKQAFSSASQESLAGGGGNAAKFLLLTRMVVFPMLEAWRMRDGGFIWGRFKRRL